MPAFMFNPSTPASTANNRKKVARPLTSPISVSTTAVKVLDARSDGKDRTGLDLLNRSSSTCYIKYATLAGTPATAANADLIIPPYTHYEFPGEPYNGEINAIWSAADASGKLQIVEWTES